MKLAVCLLTADRSGYTADTVASFVECADRPEFIRLHADDGSCDASNMRIAEAGEFDTVYRVRNRRGPVAAVRAMWNAAAERGATHILHLENDWQFERGLVLREDCQTQRLYADLKSRHGDRSPTGPHIMGTKERIEWQTEHAQGESAVWQRGVAHWGGPPSITQTELLVRAIGSTDTFKGVSLALSRLDTLRRISNTCWHIGETRTPGAKFNA